MKKSWMVLGSAVLSLSLAGCGDDNNAGGNNDNNNGAKIQTNEVRPIANNRTNNRKLRISDRAEQKVERLDEVDNAHVIISNNNAYVTVRLADNNNRANNNRENGANNGNKGNNATIRGNNGNTRTFTDNGTINQNRNNGAINGLGDAGTRDNTTSDPGQGGIGIGGNSHTGTVYGAGNGNQTGNNNNLNMNNENNNNNTAGTLNGNNYSEVSTAFEQKIADQVRKADNKIHKVYVSVNPDLYNRMNTYADDIRTNRNRDGLFEDFNNTVNNFFGRDND